MYIKREKGIGVISIIVNMQMERKTKKKKKKKKRERKCTDRREGSSSEERCE